MIACGSWGDDSNSHNNPSALLQPGAIQGKPDRLFIFDRAFQSQPCTIHGSGMIPQSNPPAWKRPPETLASPVINPALPPWHQTRHIRFTDAGPTPTGPAGTGWTFGAGAMLETFFLPPAILRPPGNPISRAFVQTTIVDLESTPLPPPNGTPQPNLYFGLQAELTWTDGVTIWWTNWQSEYR